MSPRISTPPEILQVGTPFRDVTNRNKSKRSKFRNHIKIFTPFIGLSSGDGEVGRLEEKISKLQSRIEQLEKYIFNRRANSDKYIYEDTEGSTDFSEALPEPYLQNLNISFNQPKNEVMEVSVETIIIED